MCLLGLDASNRRAIDQKAEHAVHRTVCFSQSLPPCQFVLRPSAHSLHPPHHPSRHCDEIVFSLVYTRRLKIHIHSYVFLALSSRPIHIHHTSTQISSCLCISMLPCLNFKWLMELSHTFLRETPLTLNAVFEKNP